MPHFIDRNLDSPLDLLSRAGRGREARAPRRVRHASTAPCRRYFDDDRLRRLFSFQALYAGLDPLRALALYAVITYMDTVEGVWVADGGMHAAAGRAGRRRDARRGHHPLRRRGHRHPAPHRPAPASPASRWPTARSCPPTPSSAPSTPPRPTAACCPTCGPRAACARATTRRRRSSGTSASGARRRPRPPTTTSTSAQQWAEAFEALIRTRRADARPVAAGVGALDVRPVAGARRAAARCSSSSRCRTCARRPRLGRRGQADARPPARASSTPRATRPTSSPSGSSRPTDWQAEGLTAGTPFALAHTFAQTGPFRPRNTDRHLPGLVFAGAGTTPGVGVPMVLLSGRLAAERVRAYLPDLTRVRTARHHDDVGDPTSPTQTGAAGRRARARVRRRPPSATTSWSGSTPATTTTCARPRATLRRPAARPADRCACSTWAAGPGRRPAALVDALGAAPRANADRRRRRRLRRACSTSPAARRWPAGVRFRHGLAEDVADARRTTGSCRCPSTACSPAYLFRNVGDRDAALAAVHDVLAPGGWLVTQEYSVAGSRRSVGAVDAASAGRSSSRSSLVLTRRTKLYRYLWRSVLRFDAVDRFEPGSPRPASTRCR